MYLDHIYERFFVIFTNKCNIGGEKKNQSRLVRTKRIFRLFVSYRKILNSIQKYIYIKWSNTYSVTRGLDGEDKEDKKI